MTMLTNNKDYQAPSVFTPEGLLREARRQKRLAEHPVPAVCLLDPDGDMVRQLSTRGLSTRCPFWACYHTDLHRFTWEGIEIGVVGCAVGASFAVLVAEELFASGCDLLISATSSGQIMPVQEPPYFVLIEKALRDEGTSYHYLPPSEYSHIRAELLPLLEVTESHLQGEAFTILCGATWTTDAPFRETQDAIDRHRAAGILAVEMEAAALYAFAEARRKAVVCVAHVTNQMASIDGDFEKGLADGMHDALRVIAQLARLWNQRPHYAICMISDTTVGLNGA